MVVFCQALAPRGIFIEPDKANEIAPRETRIERGKKKTAQILDLPTARNVRADLHPVQVDQK